MLRGPKSYSALVFLHDLCRLEESVPDTSLAATLEIKPLEVWQTHWGALETFASLEIKFNRAALRDQSCPGAL